MIMNYKLDETVFTEECGAVDMDQYLTRAANKTKILVVETVEEYNANKNSVLLVGDDGVDESTLEKDFAMTKLITKDNKFSLYFRGFYAITKEVEEFYFIDSPSKLNNLCRYIFKTMEYNIPSLIDAVLTPVVISDDIIVRMGMKPYPSKDEKSALMRYLNRRIAFNRDTKRLEKIIALVRIQGELMYITASKPYRYDEDDHKNVSLLPYLNAFDKNHITDIEFLALRESGNGSDWTNISLVDVSNRWDADYAIERLTIEFDLTGVGAWYDDMKKAVLGRNLPYADQIYYDIFAPNFNDEHDIDFPVRVPNLISNYINTRLSPLVGKAK